MSTMVFVATALVARIRSNIVGPFTTRINGTAITMVKITALYKKNDSIYADSVTMLISDTTALSSVEKSFKTCFGISSFTMPS